MPRFDDDDDRPRKRPPPDDDDPPPRRRRPPPDDADDDLPPRRRRARSEEIQEGPPRRRRPPADEEIEEDDRPRKRRRKKDVNDDAKPKKKKRVRPEDDEVLRKYLRRESKKHSWDFTPLEEFFIDTPALYFYWMPWIAVAVFIAFTFIGVLPPTFMLGFCIFMCVLGLAAALVGFFGCKKIYPIGKAVFLGVQGGVILLLGYVLFRIGTEYNMFD